MRLFCPHRLSKEFTLKTLPLLYCLTAALLSFEASALNVVLHDASPVLGGKAATQEQLASFKKGLKSLEDKIKDDITLHVGVSYISLKGTAIALPFEAFFLAPRVQVKQDALFKLLSAASKSDIDKQAIASLQKYQKSVSFLSLGFSKDILDQSKPFVVNKNNTVCNLIRMVPIANMKALIPGFDPKKTQGVTDHYSLKAPGNEPPITLDGIIVINTDTQGDYDWSAIFNHEMLGIMGLQTTSIVTLQSASLPTCEKAKKQTACWSKKTFEGTPLGTIADLFRYSKQSAAANVVDWTASKEPSEKQLAYFSIDGGKTPIMYFSFGGPSSKEQSGAWADPATLQSLHAKGYKFELDINQKQFGLNGPITSPAFNGQLSKADLIALDAIGWDVAY